MAATGKSLPDRISRWEVLISNLKPTSTEMPHVAADLDELEQLLGEARTLFSRQEDQRAEARETSRQLRELASRGDSIRSRVGANLQGRHGFTSELLVKYGFKPRRVPRRRVKKEQPPQAPAPTAPPAPASPPAA